MNGTLIFRVTLMVALLQCILWALLWFCFDHSIGATPPGTAQLVMGSALQVLAFPMTMVVALLGKDPPYFFISSTVLFGIGALVWAVIFERALWLFERSGLRDLRHECRNQKG